ncbi:hypothetical protein K1T71_003511 [Dendrolimus kikuchii]|uniref:Uncharacterized protein n=1 Tax=Dendrolimus kikuchii TaxID=765133 RepID=A0ACC1DCP2_9NEOP|nr:hypothetical protein K1T71_003511 [Dendrolimus kikuchii]
MGLFKRGCWEIPEIMGASAIGLIGICLATIGVYNYIRNDGDNREYRSVYYIVRPEDPRAKLLKNPVYTQYKC